MKISLMKYQGSVFSLDFVEGHRSPLRVLRPAVLSLAYTFHETIGTEPITDQDIQRILEEIQGSLLGTSPNVK